MPGQINIKNCQRVKKKWEHKQKFACSCIECLTWQLQADMRDGGAGYGGRLWTVDHVRLKVIGLPVHHCQAQSQSLSVGLSSDTTHSKMLETKRVGGESTLRMQH